MRGRLGMHPDQFQAFERVCGERGAGGSVLEIGAVPSEDSLLCLRSLTAAARTIGVNLDGPSTFRDFTILKGNSQDLSCFRDGEFDTVLCNAVLEHDLLFWKSLEEMHRVTRTGGLIVVGVPGFVESRPARWRARISRSAFGRVLFPRRSASLLASTPVLQVHDYPSDYYRFSPQAVAELFMRGLNDVRVFSHMRPPRIIGSGIKP
jgi:SAM-dependent methyltransferase